MASNGKSSKNGRADGNLYAGIDIGGTKIYTVITDARGTVLGSAKKKTKAEGGFKKVMERAVKCLDDAAGDAKVDRSDLVAVGVGAPSPILPDGTAVNAPNMKWFDEPLVKTLRKMTDRPVFAENDCNAGTLGEYALGAGKGAKTLLGLFVGTGLGGGLVYHGELVRGENRKGAEFGHVNVHPGGRMCGCGHRGCLEAYTAKAGMGRRFGYEILVEGRTSKLTELCDGDYANVRSGLLSEAYKDKDGLVVETLHESAEYLGVAIAGWITTIGPDVVVVGGGLYEALGKELLPRVKDAAVRYTHPPESVKDTKIVLASLADDAVALGAMVYARDSLAAEG